MSIRSRLPWFNAQPVAIFIVLASLIFTGCIIGGRDDDATETNSPAVDEILDEGAARWDETDSAAFDLQIDGETYLDTGETIQLQSAEGELKRPDEATATANVSFGFVNLEVSLVFVGEDAYMTDILTGSWGNAPGDFSYNPGVLMDPDSGVSAVIVQLDDPRLVNEEVVNGRATYHVRGTVPDTLIDNMTGGGLNGDEITVDIWFDQETYDVLKLSLAEPPNEDGDATVWIMTLTDHNQPVNVERPVS